MRIKKLILILFLLFILNYSMNFHPKVNLQDGKNDFEFKVKAQGYWYLTGSILIDNDEVTQDWAYYALNYDWCSGSGTFADPYIIENIRIDAEGSDWCLIIGNSRTHYFIIRNCTFLNTDTEYGYGALGLANVDNGLIYNNTCTNSVYGLHLYDSHNNTFKENRVVENTNGILMEDSCDENIIYNNTIIQNEQLGLSIDGCYDGSGNKVISNNIEDNGDFFPHYGVQIFDSYYQEVKHNNITNNGNGIFLNGFNGYHTISENNISENNLNGIYITDNSINNSFTRNQIVRNNENGIIIPHLNPTDNIFYLNWLIGNGENGRDDSSFGNFYDNGSIGNYWDDYNGTDANDDGIGDTAFTVIGTYNISMDNYPIWFSPPEIVINSPDFNEGFGVNAPSFNVYISDPNLNTTWYTIGNSIDKINFTVNGTIDQDLWNAQPEGDVLITFYANDTLPNLNSKSVKVIKDLGPPNLTINSPLPDTLFSDVSPIFNIEVSDPNLNLSWYSLNGGITKTFFTSNGSIDQFLWDSIPDGQIEIIFYTNDTVGNLVFDSVVIRKDTHSPVINIISPNPYDLFGIPTIEFSVEVSDLYLYNMWYIINGYMTNISFSTNGTVDTNMWNSFSSGELTLTFYANDTSGRISFDSIQIIKDIDSPVVSIQDPNPGEIFYVIPPEFEVTVVDPHFEHMWYTLDGGTTNITFTSFSGSISQTAWDAVPVGQVMIRFYASDSLGNIGYSDITVSKEEVSEPPVPGGIPGYLPISLIAVISISVLIIIMKYRKRIK